MIWPVLIELQLYCSQFVRLVMANEFRCATQAEPASVQPHQYRGLFHQGSINCRAHACRLVRCQLSDMINRLGYQSFWIENGVIAFEIGDGAENQILVDVQYSGRITDDQFQGSGTYPGPGRKDDTSLSDIRTTFGVRRQIVWIPMTEFYIAVILVAAGSNLRRIAFLIKGSF